MFKWYIEPCACKSSKELEDLLLELERKIDSLEAGGSTSAKVAVTVQIRGEYNAYVTEYGIPENGMFDEDLLAEIRERLQRELFGSS